MTMNVQIIVDSRETKLFSLLTERDLDIYKDNISIQKEQLELGDIHIIFNEITYIYERKTVNDLLSSIKDGRYKEQKNRLLANSFNLSPTYSAAFKGSFIKASALFYIAYNVLGSTKPNFAASPATD